MEDLVMLPKHLTMPSMLVLVARKCRKICWINWKLVGNFVFRLEIQIRIRESISFSALTKTTSPKRCRLVSVTSHSLPRSSNVRSSTNISRRSHILIKVAWNRKVQELCRKRWGSEIWNMMFHSKFGRQIMFTQQF